MIETQGLPESFEPSGSEVIIGRGRKTWNHCGNARFRGLVSAQLHNYGKANTRVAKSAILANIIRHVQEMSPLAGGFVKQDPVTKLWYGVDDLSARATVAQAFRNALSSKYRSSKQAKREKRWNKRIEIVDGGRSSIPILPKGCTETPLDLMFRQPTPLHGIENNIFGILDDNPSEEEDTLFGMSQLLEVKWTSNPFEPTPISPGKLPNLEAHTTCNTFAKPTRIDLLTYEKLATLFRKDTDLAKCLETKAIQQVHQQHFKDRTFASFSPLFKQKARQWELEKTLKGKRNQKEEVEGSEEDDSLEEEEDDSSEEEEEDDDMPPKKATKKAAKPAAKSVEKLADRVSTMSVSPAALPYQTFSMTFRFPFMIKNFNHNGRKGCTVEFMILTVQEENIRPAMTSTDILSVSLVVPEFFGEEERLMVANVGIQNFTANNHEATAHQGVVQDIRKAYKDATEILGVAQDVRVPFPCELDILHWEILLFNGDEEVSAASGHQQYFSILKVDLLAIEKPTGRRHRGGIRMVGSPVLADHQQQQQQQQQQGSAGGVP